MLLKWQKFQQQPRSAQTLVLQALFTFPIVALGIRWFGFNRTQIAIERFAAAPDVSGRDFRESWPLVQETARMVQAASDHGPLRGNCLCRSLVLWWLLRRQVIPSDLRIVVSKSEGRFEAHACVEWLGNALNDLGNVRERFAAFERPISAAGAEFK